MAAHRVTALLRAMSTLASDAPKLIPTSSPNLIWLERELNQISNSQAVQIHALERRTHKMAKELEKVQSEHADSLSEFKRTVGTTSWRVCIVGGSALLTVITVHE